MNDKDHLVGQLTTYLADSIETSYQCQPNCIETVLNKFSNLVNFICPNWLSNTQTDSSLAPLFESLDVEVFVTSLLIASLLSTI